MSRPGRASRGANAAKLANVDWALVLLVITTVAVGSTAILSATRSAGGGFGLAAKQVIFLVAGLALMGVVSMIDYVRLRQSLPVIAGGTVVVLIAVLTRLGTEVKGTQGWFILGGFSIQPAEFAKLTLIILLAAIFTGRTGNVEAPRIAASLAVLGVISALVILQGETGSVLVYCAIALGVYLVAGMPTRFLLLLVVSAISIFAVIFTSGILQGYQQDRLTSFIDQEANTAASYNQVQSEIAIGSGGLTGQGLFDGQQTQSGFVPEQETDFIFTVIAEELGFVGAGAVLLLEGLILLRVFRIAQLARDGFGTLLCVGVFCMFLIHVVQNVGMTMRLMPITGIPLPFISYGGSSLMTSLLAVGLVQTVAVHRRRGLI